MSEADGVAKNTSPEVGVTQTRSGAAANSDPQATLDGSAAAGVAAPTYSTAARESESFGPYQLIQKLGEGGMGEVWLAEQREPVRRRAEAQLIAENTFPAHRGDGDVDPDGHLAQGVGCCRLS